MTATIADDEVQSRRQHARRAVRRYATLERS